MLGGSCDLRDRGKSRPLIITGPASNRKNYYTYDQSVHPVLMPLMADSSASRLGAESMAVS
jgi:hypothetical protein